MRFFWRDRRDGMTCTQQTHEVEATADNGPTPRTLCGIWIGVRRMNEPYSMRDGKTENVTCPTCRAKGGPQ